MRIELTPKAHEDLSRIWDYSAHQWGKAQAETYIRNIGQTIESLLSSCNASQNVDFIRTGYRRIQSGSHVIFFKYASETITVIRILHQKMDIEKHLST